MSPALALPCLATQLMAAGLVGCSTPGATSPAPARPSTLDAAAVARACSAAAQPVLPVVRITEATLVAAASQRAKLPNGSEVGPPLPEHCLLRGRIDERTGADGQPYHTGFELRLPSAFAGRFFYQGGGGNDGVLALASAATPVAMASPTTPWRAALRWCPPTPATRARRRHSASTRRPASSMPIGPMTARPSPQATPQDP